MKIVFLSCILQVLLTWQTKLYYDSILFLLFGYGHFKCGGQQYAFQYDARDGEHVHDSFNQVFVKQ